MVQGKILVILLYGTARKRDNILPIFHCFFFHFHSNFINKEKGGSMSESSLLFSRICQLIFTPSVVALLDSGVGP